MTAPGPIEIEVIGHALVAAAAEMDVTVWRTSRSTIVRELLDYSTAVFDAAGNNLAQSARIPQHLNSMSHLLRALLTRPDAAAWGAGDVVVTNDPYSGGQHLPDIVAFKPVVVEGVRIAFVGTLCHHIDVGGLAAGSYAAKATEIFQEGLRIPPLLLVRGGVRDATLWAMIGANVRQPALLLGDLESQLASLEVGAVAVRRLAARHGPAGMLTAAARILDMSEVAMRAAIRRIPDGTYTFTDWLDDDGVVVGEALRIAVSVTVAGDCVHVDLSGCSAQATGPVNATLASSRSAVLYAVMCAAMAVSGTTIAANAGCYRPVTIHAPEGSCVNARFPAPVVHRIAVCHTLLNAMQGALHQALPAHMPAAYYGTSYVCTFQSIRADGARDVLVEIEIGGAGAHPAGDGANALSTGMHNNSAIPVEMVESGGPITVLEYALRPGSGGVGAFRGGLGLVRAWRVDAPRCLFTANMDRFVHPPWGLAGGGAGAAPTLTLWRDGVATALPSKCDNVSLVRGDVVRLETAGGGGFGDAAGRDPAAVARDAALGYA